MSQATQSNPPARPGQMTAVMRAVTATGPKVLRIGLVVGGRVMEERIIKERIDVTVGPSERSMFVLSTEKIRSSHTLFEVSADSYALNFFEGMSGRVALPTGVSDLDQLKGHAKKSSGGIYQVRLTEDSRGKVVIGDTTFLFQFVAPPPVQPRPQLPVAVTRGATGVDWGTTIIAAFAFFAHFMAIGAMYTDWLDPIIDEQMSLAGLIENIEQLPPPPPVEEKPVEEAEDSKDAEVAQEKQQQQTSKSDSKVPDQPGQKLNAAQAAALSNELEQLSMLTLGALGASGPATAGVLQGGEVPTGALDAAASSGAGVGVGGDLKFGSGGGVVTPGQRAGLGSIGSSTATTGSGTGGVKEVQGPTGNANVSSSVAAGNISGAAAVVAGMRAGFRRCYQRGLDANPDIAGSIRLTIQVGPGGNVSSVSGGSTGNLPGTVVDCVKARAQASQFNPPDGGSAVIDVPVTFVKQ